MITARALCEALASPDVDNVVAALFSFMTAHGGSRYDDQVSQIEHALQCATLALDDRLDPAVITAALLHDIGHSLLDEHAGSPQFLTLDRGHELVGAAFLSRRFAPSVTEPIRLHVMAKRYLCTVDHGYYATLSLASKRSFVAQGSGLLEEERAALEAETHFRPALALRLLDDKAKVGGLRTPRIEAFAEAVGSCVPRSREERAHAGLRR